MLRQCKCICANLIQVRIHSRFFSGRDPFHGVPFIVSLVVLHFAFNNTKVALCTIAKKTRVTTVKDTQTDLNILVMREAINARQLHKAVWCFCGEKKTVAHMHPIIHATTLQSMMNAKVRKQRF